MIAVDNTFLSLLFHPDAKPPNNPQTGAPIHRLNERIDDLMEQWRIDRESILIPTPALSEFLFLADNDGPAYLAEIDSDSIFKIGSFDQKAAIELAALNLDIKKGLSKSKAKREEQTTDTKTKIKFDKQIVAIAIANDATTIYSDDEGVKKFAAQASILVVKSWQLPLPRAKQLKFPVEDKPAAKRASTKKTSTKRQKAVEDEEN